MRIAGEPRSPVPDRVAVRLSSTTDFKRRRMPLADLTSARSRITAAYDPSALENAGTKLMGTVADHFRRVVSRDSKVLNWNEPNTLIAEARRFLSKSPLAFREAPGDGSASSQFLSSTELAL